MKHIALAVAALAFAPLALAAEGQGDETQPTMLELKQSIDALGVRLGRVENTAGTRTAKLNSLATTVGTLSSTITANHATIVGKFAPQVAVAMSVPQWWSGFNGGASERFSVGNPPLYLVGSSTIAGFPAGTVAADGLFTDATLPIGTYLFELQQPHGDSAICSREVSRGRLGGTGARRNKVCPRVRLHPFHNTVRG